LAFRMAVCKAQSQEQQRQGFVHMPHTIAAISGRRERKGNRDGREKKRATERARSIHIYAYLYMLTAVAFRSPACPSMLIYIQGMGRIIAEPNGADDTAPAVLFTTPAPSPPAGTATNMLTLCMQKRWEKKRERMRARERGVEQGLLKGNEAGIRGAPRARTWRTAHTHTHTHRMV
jgi:hypothetical protein